MKRIRLASVLITELVALALMAVSAQTAPDV